MLAAAAVSAACAGASSATRPSVQMSGRDATPTAGRAWGATVQVIGSRATPQVTAARGRRSIRAHIHRRRGRTFRVVFVFPSAGTWRLAARIESRSLLLGRVRVAPAELLLAQPGQVLARPDGSLVVTERAARDRLLRVEPSGAARVLALGLDEPFGLANGRDGSLLVSAVGGVYRSGTRLAAVEAGPIAEAPSGVLFYAGRTEVGRVDPGGTVHRYALEVDIPHGLVLAPDGSVVILDSGHDRIVRLDPETGSSSVVATGLSTPLGIAREPSGALLVAEYGSGRILRVLPDGSRTRVASGLRRPYSLTRVEGGAVYVVEAGELSRPSGTLKRIDPDGAVTRIRLRLRG